MGHLDYANIVNGLTASVGRRLTKFRFLSANSAIEAFVRSVGD